MALQAGIALPLWNWACSRLLPFLHHLPQGSSGLKECILCVSNFRQANSALTPSLSCGTTAGGSFFPCGNHFELGPGGETGRLNEHHPSRQIRAASGGPTGHRTIVGLLEVRADFPSCSGRSPPQSFKGNASRTTTEQPLGLMPQIFWKRCIFKCCCIPS